MRYEDSGEVVNINAGVASRREPAALESNHKKSFGRQEGS